MQLRGSLLVFCLAASAAHSAVIYKWTDAAGVTHYSDQAVPGAEKVVTSGFASSGISAGPAHAAAHPSATKDPASGLGYVQLAIESPASEQVFFGDDQVTVRLRLEPALKLNQTIAWHLNGKQLGDQAPDATAFTLAPLPRGTYTIAATITDLGSGVSRTSDSVSFNVRQPSELAPQHRRR